MSSPPVVSLADKSASPAPVTHPVPPAGPPRKRAMDLKVWAGLKEVARWQRRLNTGYLLVAPAAFLARFLGAALDDARAVADGRGLAAAAAVLGAAEGAATAAAALVVWGGFAYVLARLSKALGWPPAWWVLAAVFPPAGLLVLLAASGAATGRLRDHGLRVGLLGARVPPEPPTGWSRPGYRG